MKDKKIPNVCIVRQNYYPDELHVRRDAETLLDSGYQVDVICLRRKGQKSKEKVNGVQVYRLPIERHRRGMLRYIFEYSAFFIMTFLRLSWLSLRRKYYAVQVVNMPDFLVFTTLIPKAMGSRVVFYLFELMPEVYADKFNISMNHFMVRLLFWIERISTRWADHIIVANGISQRERLERRGVPSSKISISLNVPDENIFIPQNGPNGNKSGFCLITHGSILERYGIQTLIRAVPLIKEEIQNLNIKILGEGEYRLSLEEMAQSMGTMNCIEFVGRVPEDEMLALLNQADIGIVSLFPQKQPQVPCKLFEYLALGKPTVSTRIPAIRAYFNEDSVMFYEPDNEHDLARCILALYRDPDKRATLAISGLATYQKYRWNATKYEYLEVFEKLRPPQTSLNGNN